MHSVKTFLWESSKRIIIFVSKYLHTALPIQNVKKTIPAMWNLLLVCTVFNELINKNFKIQGFYWFMSYNFRTIYYWIMNEFKYWLIIVSVFVFSIWTIAQGRTLFFLTGPVLNIFMFLSIVYLILCNCTYGLKSLKYVNF